MWDGKLIIDPSFVNSYLNISRKKELGGTPPSQPAIATSGSQRWPSLTWRRGKGGPSKGLSKSHQELSKGHSGHLQGCSFALCFSRQTLYLSPSITFSQVRNTNPLFLFCKEIPEKFMLENSGDPRRVRIDENPWAIK